MRTRLMAMGLLLALAATGSAADTRHYATASTKKEAKQLATADARAAALGKASCFRPAYQVAQCDKVEDGFRCRADSADNLRACRRSGWVRDRERAYLPLAPRAPYLTVPDVAGAPSAPNAWGISYSRDPFYGYGLQPASSPRIQLSPPK